MDTRRYGISLLMINSISHSFAAFTRELSSRTLEDTRREIPCLRVSMYIQASDVPVKFTP